MSYLKNILFISFVLFASYGFSQNGFIRGTVYDDATGEYLPGVTVFIEGTTTGTITDLDGKFNIAVAPGVYKLRVSFISYETLSISDVQVNNNKVTLFDNLRLKEASVSLSEVVIVAQQVRSSENALLTIKRKSANVMDGISASNLRKIGDSDAASSIKRVPGVSVEGGKYVFVRGLGDRYTKTTLNGVDIPGLDPDRNSLQMDIFPSNLIDNIIVHKSFSAELPADFTGGVVDIAIKDFPEEKKGNISFQTSYNPNFHFNSEYLTYEGSGTDFLGYDNGARDIPAIDDIPQFSEVVGDPDGARAARYKEILHAFNPVMAAEKKSNLMDGGFGFSFGNQIPLSKNTIGYNVAFSYKNSTEFYKDAQFSRYGLVGDPDVKEMDNRDMQVGNYGVNNVMLSGLAGFAFKTLSSKYRLYFLHLQSGESKAGIFSYTSSDQGAIFEGIQHNLDYSQRSLSNILIDGKHNFQKSRWEIEWKISPTLSKMEDPDIRFTRYIFPEGHYIISTESGFPERIWRDLEETSIGSLVHVTKEFDLMGNTSKVKFGGAYTFKERDFIIRNFALNVRNIPLTGDPNELFHPDNLWPYEGNAGRGTTFEAAFYPVNPNQFNANIYNAAGYLSGEFVLVKDLKIVAGVRLEKYIQRYTGQDQLGSHVLNNEKVLDDLNLFPSANLIYSVSQKQNLRFSYSQTIARPSFKELSYAEIFDPVSGRTFIGGLFRDANDEVGITYWDGNLVSTGIQNIDLRWEYYQELGQMVSLSGFFKSFDKPIEMVQYATQTGSFQPRNVGDGTLIGAEVELRQNLGFIHPSVADFQLTANVTFTDSRIEMSKTEYDSRVDNARTGQVIDKERDMAGQAPYIVNAGLAYNGGEAGFWQGFEAGLYYNVQGETLQFVGIADRPDIYSKPFHSLNFNTNKSFGREKRFQVGLKVENILNAKVETVFKSFEANDQYFSRLSAGTSFHLRFSYNLFK